MRWLKLMLRHRLDPRTLHRDGLPFDESGPNPAFLDLKDRLGEAMNAGDHDAARAVLDEMVRRWPLYPWIHLIAARMYESMGDLTAARATAGIGLVLDPENYNFHSTIGRALRAEGLDELADEVLEQGWRLCTELVPSPSEEERERFFEPMRFAREDREDTRDTEDA